MDPFDLYARTARHRWWIPVVFAAASIGVAVLFTSRQTPVYRTSATSAVVPADELEDASDVMRGLETLERRTVVATFAMVAEARATRQSAAARLGLETDEVQRYSVDASVVPSTNIIRITVEGPDPEGASRLANTLADVTAAEARDMYRIFGMRPLQAASPRWSPIWPTPGRNYTVAAILGVFLGVIVAIGVEYLWPSGARAPAASGDHQRAGDVAAG